MSDDTFNPFFNYNLGKGWFVGTVPVIIATWPAPGNKAWTVPVGAQAGTVKGIDMSGASNQIADHKAPLVEPAWPPWLTSRHFMALPQPTSLSSNPLPGRHPE
jgi:hypothetical protein